MKTLDEVIEAIGFCKSGNLSKCKDCPYIGTCELDYAVLSDDALHYLKKYRDNYKARNDQVERYQKAAKECEEILIDYVALKQYWAEQQTNPALTWEELKTMEGKPVWIEVGLLRPRWFLIEGFNGEQMIGVDALSVRVPFYEDAFYTGGCKAYRKERM